MKKTFKFLVFMMTLVLAGGVVGYYQLFSVDYAYKGGGKTLADVFHGKISLNGSHYDVTIKSGSEVESVIIKGNDNTIRIEEGAHVAAVQGLGNNNIVDAPADMEIDLRLLKGQNNGRKKAIGPSLDGL